MVAGSWGLLGPEFLTTTRRARALNLGAAVRHFNDLAVPGLGGAWFGKQFLLATLGVVVAQEARNRGAKVQNIEVANAIEALACWLAYRQNKWQSDSRLKGITLLQGKDFSFKKARQKGFYVTQPMRMAMVQALPALGFVETHSTRFNSFSCSDAGIKFIEKASSGFRPYKRTVVEHLVQWVLEEDNRVDSETLYNVLSPLSSLSPEAMKWLREMLMQGTHESARRRDALNWVDSVSKNRVEASRAERPKEITVEHWRDLQAGALFFKVREAAISALNEAEAYMAKQSTKQFLCLKSPIPQRVIEFLEKVKSSANVYLNNYSEINEDATSFCRECIVDDLSDILRSLVKRDERVLRLLGNEVKPGPAFSGSPAEMNDDEESPVMSDSLFPENISYRIRNLYLLNLDMNGELDDWLTENTNRRAV